MIKDTLRKLASLFPLLKIKTRYLIRRIPRRLRVFGGPILGALIGLIGGVPGVIIGAVLGYLIGKLFVQSFQDRKILDYMESPGGQDFYEGEPGLASWCALGVLLTREDPAEIAVRRVLLAASVAFSGPLADPFLMEHFSRLALSRKEALNPDLLAESFTARRAKSGDAARLGRSLADLAEGENANRLASGIIGIIDPRHTYSAAIRPDPWMLLGLSPGTPRGEVKAHYRRLAKQFHPDELEVLDEKHRQAAARAFIAIKEAYTEIAGG